MVKDLLNLGDKGIPSIKKSDLCPYLHPAQCKKCDKYYHDTTSGKCEKYAEVPDKETLKIFWKNDQYYTGNINYNGKNYGPLKSLTIGFTDLSMLFDNAQIFNEDISEWDVSKVTNMSYMFRYCYTFNQPLNKWDVSNVTNMSNMFQWARVFNQPLNDWNVSKVTNMSTMFEGAWAFNQPLNKWNVSNVTNMNNMFEGGGSQAVPAIYSSYSFAKLKQQMHFNQSLNSWNISNVTTLKRMFYSHRKFDPANVSNWNVTGKDGSANNSFYYLGCPTGSHLCRDSTAWSTTPAH